MTSRTSTSETRGRCRINACPGTYINPADGITYCCLTGEEPDCEACDADGGMDDEAERED